MENNKTETPQYKKETAGSLVGFLAECPNFIAVLVSAILTGSLSMYMDLLNSFSNTFRTGFVTFLSKKLQKNLKYTYNYGIERLETLAMMFCDALMIMGTLCIFAVAILKLFKPGGVSDLLIIALILKIVNVIADAGLLYIQWRVRKQTHTKVAEESYQAMLGSFLFDFAVFIAVLSTFVFKGQQFVVYIEPIASIIIAICIIYKAAIRIKDACIELTDKTLSEDKQLEILKVLNKHLTEYDELKTINSHQSGDTLYIDLKLTFENNETYQNIQELENNLSKEYNEEFGKCKVTIVINND